MPFARHLLVHDFGAVERLERGVDEAERDAEEEDHGNRRVCTVHVRVPRLPELGRERGHDREKNSEEEATEVETRTAVDAVRERRTSEGSCAREDVVREVVEALRVLVCNTGVREDSRQEVRDELWVLGMRPSVL